MPCRCVNSIETPLLMQLQVNMQAEAPDGRRVAVKALSLRGLRDWKQLQLFEREAATLRGLDHPCIPAYVDHFELDTADDRGFFLVQVGRTDW